MAAPGLEFRISAELGQFLQQMQQGDAGVNKAMASMGQSVQRFEGALDRMGKSARESAGVFQAFETAGAEFRQLQGQLDPAVRALHQFEAAQEMVTRAVKAGAVSQDQANAVLAQARTRYEATTASLATASARGARGVGGFGSAAQQAGYQIGDFAVQIQSGTNPLVAFTQQSSQLLGAFGPWGAVLGAAGAVVGALGTSFLGASGDAGTLEDSLDALNGAVGDLRDAANINADGIQAIIENYGKLDEQTITLIQRQVRLRQELAETAAAQSLAGLTGAADDVLPGVVVGRDPNVRGDRERGTARGRRQVELADELGVSRDQIAEIQTALYDLGQADALEEKSAAAARLGNALQAINVDEASDGLVQFLNKVNETQLSVKELEEANRKAAAAADLLSQGPEAVTRVATAEDDEKAAGSRRKAIDAIQEQIDKLREMGVSLEVERGAIGLTGEALARYTAEAEAAAAVQQILNRAAEENINLTPTQRQAIDALADSYVDLAVAVDEEQRAADAAAKANEEAKRSMETLVSGFSSAVQNADSFADALKRVGIQIAELALKGALLGEGPFAAGGAGGSILDSLLTSAVGGYWSGGTNLAADPTPGVTGRASGGPVRAGVPYAINEHLHGGKKTEMFVPSVNGAVLNVAQAQQAARGGAAPVNASFSTTITGTGLSARELAAVLERRDKQMVSKLNEAVKRGGR